MGVNRDARGIDARGIEVHTYFIGAAKSKLPLPLKESFLRLWLVFFFL